ncbi:MAG: Lacal_2735 family protein [Bacteroidetes bacterium]|nr:Lacal_2735 family protein [Bacteroidota bacterium]
MFGLFGKNSKKKTLQKKYQRLLEEAYRLSAVNRKASDEKSAEADRVLKEIEALETAA